MYGDLETMEAYWKKLEYDASNVDKKVCNRPCFLYAAHLTGSAGAVSTAIIRDGHDVTGEPVIYLAAVTSGNDIRSFDPPLYFKKGLFIDMVSNATSILVHYLPAVAKKE